MATYRPSYRRAFQIPVAIAVLAIFIGLILGQTLGTHQRLVNQQEECRAPQVGVTVTATVPATRAHASFMILTITPHKGVSCTLSGYPGLANAHQGTIPLEHLGPRFGLSAVTITASHKSPDEVLISPATIPYGFKMPDNRGLVILNQHATTVTHTLAITPIFAHKDLTSVRSLATQDLKPTSS